MFEVCHISGFAKTLAREPAYKQVYKFPIYIGVFPIRYAAVMCYTFVIIVSYLYGFLIYFERMILFNRIIVVV